MKFKVVLTLQVSVTRVTLTRAHLFYIHILRFGSAHRTRQAGDATPISEKRARKGYRHGGRKGVFT